MTKIAYSYIRFSTEAQADGDSVRRQLKETGEYCERNGLVLNDDFKLMDRGVTAFTGKNASKGALGRFIAACKAGKIPRGSALVVESLDRISRQSPRKTVRLLGEILDDYGIEVHLTQAGKVFHPDEEENEGIDLILAVAMSMRAHEESKTKSKRISEAWADKRERARSAGHILTPSCPWWLKRDGNTFEVIEDRAAVVREIYEMAAKGIGGKTIAIELTRRGIEPPGRHTSRRKGEEKSEKRIGTFWRESTIRAWLVARSPEGTLRATWKTRRKTEDYTIDDYYPRIVPEDLAERAHGGRKAAIGRPANPDREINVWKGISLRAHDATTPPDGQWVRWQGHANGARDVETGKRSVHYYINSLHDDKKQSIISVPCRTLERLVSIAVSTAGNLEGLSEAPSFGIDLQVKVEAAKHAKKDAEQRLENLLRLAETGTAPAAILKRIVETEKELDRIEGQYQAAKASTQIATRKIEQSDVTRLLEAGKSEALSRSQLAGILRRLVTRIDLARDVAHLVEVGEFGKGITTLWPWGGVENRKVIALIEFTGGARWLATNKPGECALRISRTPKV